jgi:hypothetical protein
VLSLARPRLPCLTVGCGRRPYRRESSDCDPSRGGRRGSRRGTLRSACSRLSSLGHEGIRPSYLPPGCLRNTIRKPDSLRSQLKAYRKTPTSNPTIRLPILIRVGYTAAHAWGRGPHRRTYRGTYRRDSFRRELWRRSPHMYSTVGSARGLINRCLTADTRSSHEEVPGNWECGVIGLLRDRLIKRLGDSSTSG